MTSRRGLVMALFAVYLVLLAWGVLWKFDVPYVGELVTPTIKLIPFLSTGDAGGSAPLEVLANVVFFIPFGLYLGVLIPRSRRWTSAGTVAAVSLAFEVAQYFLRIGVPDVSDLIANTAGGVVGIAIADQWQTERITPVAARAFAVATGLALIGLAAFLASPVHYAPPRDVIPLHCDATAQREWHLIGCGP